MGNYRAKLVILLYDNFGGNQTPLRRNGMAAIPKMAPWKCVNKNLNFVFVFATF